MAKVAVEEDREETLAVVEEDLAGISAVDVVEAVSAVAEAASGAARARCTRQSVLSAGRNVKFLSSLQETSLSIARNAIGRNAKNSSSSD